MRVGARTLLPSTGFRLSGHDLTNRTDELVRRFPVPDGPTDFFEVSDDGAGWCSTYLMQVD